MWTPWWRPPGPSHPYIFTRVTTTQTIWTTTTTLPWSSCKTQSHSARRSCLYACQKQALHMSLVWWGKETDSVFKRHISSNILKQIQHNSLYHLFPAWCRALASQSRIKHVSSQIHWNMCSCLWWTRDCAVIPSLWRRRPRKMCPVWLGTCFVLASQKVGRTHARGTAAGPTPSRTMVVSGLQGLSAGGSTVASRAHMGSTPELTTTWTGSTTQSQRTEVYYNIKYIGKTSYNYITTFVTILKYIFNSFTSWIKTDS